MVSINQPPPPVQADRPKYDKLHSNFAFKFNLRRYILECIKEIQAQCFRLGIPLKTRHREVAPNQYEFAPLFGRVLHSSLAPWDGCVTRSSGAYTRPLLGST